MAEWARLTATTIADYVKGVEDELSTKQILMAAMKKAGNISYNHGGDTHNWAVEYREIPLTVNNGEQTITPQRQDYIKRVSVPWIGYNVADSMTKREKLVNQKGPWQLVDYFKEMTQRAMRNFTRQFQEEFYIDSSATGNSGRLGGFETMFATNGTLTITSGAQRAANAADVVGYPNDTYAGLSTAIGTFGSWATQSTISTAWPAGKGTLSFDYFSPVVVCYNSTAWAGAANDWASNCLKASRYTITHMQRYDKGDQKSIKLLLLDRDLYRQFLDKQDSKEHMWVNTEYSLRALGFKDTFMQDGAEVCWEWGVPGGVGYGLNVDNMELMAMQDTLFVSRGPTFESLNNAYHVIVDFLGQIKFITPSRFAKLITIAA